MRKFTVIPLAALLVLAVAAPASAGPNVSNSSGSAQTAQGSWSSDDGSYGSVYAWQETGTTYTYLDFFEESGQYVDCTPADDTDDFYGFQGQYRYGYGEGSLTIGRGSSDAHASGTLEVSTYIVDDCAGEATESWVSGVPFSFDLVATGPKVMERGTSSFKIPGEYNGHSTYSTTSRTATGTALIGDALEVAIEGGIGKVSWRDHGNS
jgi:hypothetical protein